MARGGGGGGRLFEGGDYFKYFGQTGVIIRGRRLIEGRLLSEEIRYVIKRFFCVFVIVIALIINTLLRFAGHIAGMLYLLNQVLCNN